MGYDLPRERIQYYRSVAADTDRGPAFKYNIFPPHGISKRIWNILPVQIESCYPIKAGSAVKAFGSRNRMMIVMVRGICPNAIEKNKHQKKSPFQNGPYCFDLSMEDRIEMIGLDRLVF